MIQLTERYFLKPIAKLIGSPSDPRSRGNLISRVVHDLSRRYVEYHAHAQRKIRAAAIIGVFGFPVFFLVWSYVLPQPFESALLRGIGTGLCLALALSPFWPSNWQRYSVAFSYFTFLYCLPFFFTLMLLFNDSNAAWEMSTLAALIYVVLLYDLVNAIVVLVIGSLAAIAAYLLLTSGAHIPDGYWTTLPILVFALTGFLGLAYSDNLIAREKLKAAASLASQVAHECRTPLTGIRFEADGCERLISRLPMSAVRDKLAASHRRVRQHITAANSVIDLLLTNVAQHHRGSPTAELHNMSAIVAQALERYSFKTSQRDLVHIDVADDFQFRGSDLLMTHVLFNLLKNGLRAIEARGGSENRFSIALRRGPHSNMIVVSDTGEGIPPEMLNYLFIPFVSAQRPGVGTGLGLSFCRMIIEGAGGTISCSSMVDVGTSFTIELPVVEPVAENAAAA
jgi:two-component system CAI-1 autoinducer sensor kinase/phosphatase CqsS